MTRTALTAGLTAATLTCLGLAACAAPLATLPPSTTYREVEDAPPQLTSEERDLVDDVNKELNRLGVPSATVGSYETNAARIMANAALAKVWAKSGRALAKDDSQNVQGPVSGEEQGEGNRRQVAAGRLASLTDETEDVDLKHLHVSQRLIAEGMPSNLRVLLLQTPYQETRIGDGAHGKINGAHSNTELIKLVRVLRPRVLNGQLMIGVAILPAGDAGARIFSVAIRDRSFDLRAAPPRTASPGDSFEVAGTVVDQSIRNVKVGLLSPDGQVKLGLVPVDARGNFTATLTLPKASGLYLVSVGRQHGDAEDTFTVPVFAGVTPSAWPVSADPKATSVDGTRSIAQRMAQAMLTYRHEHGLKTLQFDPALSAFAKSEAVLRATAEDEQSGAGAGFPQQKVTEGYKDRRAAAGYAEDQVSLHWTVQTDDYVNNFFVRFPGTPSEVAVLASPSAEVLGVGVALVPNAITKDDDLTRYAIVWAVKDPTPQKPEVPADQKPTSAVAPAPSAPTAAK